jgi:hypothetical protein
MREREKRLRYSILETQERMLLTPSSRCGLADLFQTEEVASLPSLIVAHTWEEVVSIENRRAQSGGLPHYAAAAV